MSIKVGRRNNKADMERIQRVHDLMIELGATCDGMHGDTGDDSMEGESTLEELIESVLESPYQPYVRAELYGGIERAELSDADFVFPDERAFPVMTRGDVQDAVSSWGRYRGEQTFETFKERLIALSRRKGIDDALPVSWQAAKSAGAVKALGNGRVGGYLVLFSGNEDPDLTGEFFTKSTDFGVDVGDPLPVYYQHGQDERLGRRRLGKAAVVKVDDIGVWIEAQLQLRDDYERAVYGLIEAGKLGWSSGAASHLVDRRMAGKSVEITYWQLAEASLTPTPAEPRTSADTIKASPEAGQQAATRAAVITVVAPTLTITE